MSTREAFNAKNPYKNNPISNYLHVLTDARAANQHQDCPAFTLLMKNSPNATCPEGIFLSTELTVRVLIVLTIR